MYVVILIVLAIAAYFLIQYMKKRSTTRSLENSAQPHGELTDGRPGAASNAEGTTGADAAARHAEGQSTAAGSSSAVDSSTGGSSTGGASKGGAAAAAAAAGTLAAGAAAAAVAAGAQAGGTSGATSGATARVSTGSHSTGATNDATQLAGGDKHGNVREMMKILNLRDADASRLGISKDDFNRLWKGDASADAGLVDEVTDRLQRMLG